MEDDIFFLTDMLIFLGNVSEANEGILAPFH